MGRVSVEDVDKQRGPGSQMDVTQGALLLGEESPSKRPGSLNNRGLSPVWSPGSSNSSTNRGPVRFGVFLPVDASEREKGIHSFLEKMDIFAIDLKTTLESEGRIECKSP